MRTWQTAGLVLSVLSVSVSGFANSRHVNLRETIVKQSVVLGVPAEIALAVAYKESGIQQWHKDGTLVLGDGGGAIGIFQIHQDSAPSVDLTNPVKNIRAGVRILRDLHDRYNDWSIAVAAFNIGAGHADKNLQRGIPFERWKVFSNYVVFVLARAEMEHINICGGANEGCDLYASLDYRTKQ